MGIALTKPEKIFERWYYSNGKIYLIVTDELLDHLKKKCGENSLTYALWLSENVGESASVLECTVFYPKQEVKDRK